jgi:aldo/keto reductase family protein
MHQHSFGALPRVSIDPDLGGGGLGMLWGKTTFEECVATVYDAIAAGINLLDLAPRYGDGKAEQVVGKAFGGRTMFGRILLWPRMRRSEWSCEEVDRLVARIGFQNAAQVVFPQDHDVMQAFPTNRPG